MTAELLEDNAAVVLYFVIDRSENSSECAPRAES